MGKQELTFTLNGQEIRGVPGESLLAAALRAGIHIPHFCYHKHLSVVGQCRACLVEILDAGNGRSVPKLQPSCATPIAEGMVVSSESPRVKESQEAVFEFLLKNHPLDCPVCDQGGECPLQDQAMAYGKAVSRTRESRRIYPRKEISPYIKPEMNRCVHCTRCIRFTAEIDGGGEFGWAHRGDRTEVGIFEDLPVSSIVSGNVIDICPVGALTDNKYRFTARVWEMQHVEGPCTLCAVGCRQRVWTKDGAIKRVTAGQNERVNDSWICDVGRFGWSGVHAGERLRQPLIRQDGELKSVRWREAIALIAHRLGAIREEGGGAALAGLGGGGATNEGAFQFGSFVRCILGSNRLDCRIHPRDFAQSEAQRAAFGGIGGLGSIEAVGRAKALLLVGSDPFEEHPILALRARSAWRAGASLVSVHPRRIDLRVWGDMHFLCPFPGEEARVLRALARVLLDSGVAPEGEGAEDYRKALAEADVEAFCRGAGLEGDAISSAARALASRAGEVAMIVGPGVRDAEAAGEAVNLAMLLRAELLFAPAVPNLQGALDMGVHPELLPCGRTVGDAEARAVCASDWGRSVTSAPGLSTEGILRAAEGGEIRGLYLFGCDPVTEHPDGDRVRRALERVEFVVLHASHRCGAMEFADVVLPLPTLYEEEGTLTSLERRVHRLRRALKPPMEESLPESWRAIGEIARAMRTPMRGTSLDRVQMQLRGVSAEYGAALGRLPEEGVRLGREAAGAYRISSLSPPVERAGGLRLFLAPALWLSGPGAAWSRHLWDMPPAALRLSAPDAERIGAGDGEEVEFHLGEVLVRLPARVDDTLPVGLAWAPEGALRALDGGALNRGVPTGAGGVLVQVRAAGRTVLEA